MKIRGRNEGTIRKRADGRWEGRINLGWVDGKRVRKSVYAASREEAAQLLSEFSTQRDQGLPVPHGHDTVADFLMRWLEQVRPSVRPRTWEMYELYIRKHAIPGLKSLRLSALRPEHVRKLLAAKLKAGASPRSVTHLRTVLHTALQQAVDDKLLAWNPVSSAVKRPAAKDYKYTHLEIAEARAFLEAAKGSRFEAAFTVALSLGLRRGEIMGLRWSDIDLDSQTLRVEQTIAHLHAKVAGKAGYYVGEPKTKRSRRTLALPDALIPMLRRQRVQQAETRLASGTSWQDRGLVFTNRNGGPVDPGAMHEDFKVVLRRAGLPNMRLHDLRHSAASLLLAQGVALRTIMELLGHSTIALTANTYGHSSREMVADAAAKMDSGLFGTSLKPLGA